MRSIVADIPVAMVSRPLVMRQQLSANQNAEISIFMYIFAVVAGNCVGKLVNRQHAQIRTSKSSIKSYCGGIFLPLHSGAERCLKSDTSSCSSDVTNGNMV